MNAEEADLKEHADGFNEVGQWEQSSFFRAKQFQTERIKRQFLFLHPTPTAPKEIHVDLPSGGVAKVSPDASPELLGAMNDMVNLAMKAFPETKPGPFLEWMDKEIEWNWHLHKSHSADPISRARAQILEEAKAKLLSLHPEAKTPDKERINAVLPCVESIRAQIRKALDDYARSQAIAFTEWIDANGYECFMHSDENEKFWQNRWGSGSWKTADLFLSFLDQQKQKEA
jgi:hypothetical protein